jgi:hypothetical protein
MEGGAAEPSGLQLGNIGEFTDIGDFVPLAVGTLTSLNFGIALNRFVGLGGLSLTNYFDTFGLEAVLLHKGLLLLILQAARWLYTTYYASGGRPWSPFVFLCFAIGTQIVHDLAFSYGLLDGMEKGKNDMLDQLQRIVRENGRLSLAFHSMLCAIAAILAMLLKESNVLMIILFVLVGMYVLPLLLATVGKVRAAAAAAAEAAAAAAAAKHTDQPRMNGGYMRPYY